MDQFLFQYADMVNQQRIINAREKLNHTNSALLKQMLHAQTIIEERCCDLQASITNRSIDRFIHELWSLAGDIPHFDFDVGHLTGADTFEKLCEEISLEALTLTKDLNNPENKAAFIKELGE
jgi:hypothetical protein